MKKSLYNKFLVRIFCVAVVVALDFTGNRLLVSSFTAGSQSVSGLESIESIFSFQRIESSTDEKLKEMKELGILAKGFSQWFVAPNGLKSGRGTIDSPIDLDSALEGNWIGVKIKSGDVVWLRGGRYVGSFTSRLEGAPSSPIHVRQYPGERAVIDKSGAKRETAALDVRGSHVWFWDFEVMNSFPNRAPLDPDENLDPWRGSGINVFASNTKYINLIVHDNGHGFGLWNEDGGTEIYGCLIFNNGNNKKEHGIYAHNKNGIQTITDNIIFNNAGKGLNIYANSPKSSIRGFSITQNAVFNNGALTSVQQVSDQILVGGVNGVSAGGIEIRANSIFNERSSPASKNRGIRLGYEHQSNEDLKVLDNYIVSAIPLKIYWWRSVDARRNTIVSKKNEIEIRTPLGIEASKYVMESNNVLIGENARTKIFVYANLYEKGRANIFVHTNGAQNYIDISLDQILVKGDAFEIHDAQDYFRAPILRGVYGGEAIRLPMNGSFATATQGKTELAPIHTSSEFAAFVVKRTLDRQESRRKMR